MRRIFSTILSLKSKGFVLLFLGLASVCCAQSWQSHQLTNYDNIQLVDINSAIDSNDNIHIFFTCHVRPQFEQAIYYMRASPQGDILTDSTIVDYPNQDAAAAVSLGGDRVWGLWMAPNGNQTVVRMQERDTEGNAQVISMDIGAGGVHEAAYRATDETVHWVASSGVAFYYRVSSEGDTIIWQLQVPEDRPADYSRIAVSPSGVVWGAWRYSIGQPADILLARFNDDETISTYYPFGYLTGTRWGIYDFDVDALGQFHFMVYNDTAQASYCLMDSTFNLLEWHTLIQTQGGGAGGRNRLRLNSNGDCLAIWEYQSTIWGGLRTYEGEWEQFEVLSNSHGISNTSIQPSQNGRWAVVCERIDPSNSDSDIWLFSYGFPQSDAKNLPDIRPQGFSIYPNPFVSNFSLSLPHKGFSYLQIFDILGRSVYDERLDPTVSSFTISAPHLFTLPTGAYFLSVSGSYTQRPIKIIHIH